MTDVYNSLVGRFSDVQVLDKGDPFHVSMCRETKFCTEEKRARFYNRNNRYTIAPWYNWSMSQGGVLLNDDIPEYQDKAGGFYLFVTRNRPLIYFAPRGSAGGAGGSDAYYCKWQQDGSEVAFANPHGGEVSEKLIRIGASVSDFISQHPVLQRMSAGLCGGYSYQAMPSTMWSP